MKIRQIMEKSGRGMMLSLLLATAGLSAPWAMAKESDDRFGVVVMAHGGPQSWNEGVSEMLAPLSSQYKLELAFGMADAYSLQEAIDRLEARGVDDIGVVRLFISGESWLERTQQILGMKEGAPLRDTPSQEHGTSGHGMHGAHSPESTPSATASHGNHGGMRMEFWQVDSDAQFAISLEGLSEAPEMDQILLQRARSLSTEPSQEQVLVLAHGPGDDAENERWLANISNRAELLAREGGFSDVKVATLREDWPEKREAAQQEVREYVHMGNEAGHRVLVIPYRVHGFGPYAEALEGLDYVADETGLVPHPAVAQWIERQIMELQAQ
ncbi:hypothetical protein QGM61_14680 [Pseudohongiella sp. SYSU M77423]|uniref:sirohydrochlorin chelatase n=1 Tax=Pseudohongiella sp. SYSU M77423 TaxID=3042312 RepID=UPI0024815583|nr:hypothetical protein [Pseudohongiella sp. SYSU M77423]MDH7945068.1 hypothetical protein [Pseudohongiella sp. SYSU M77423]